MGDSELNLNKLTASLEELSLKKQLPLRQQAQKPILKYNTTIAKPVHLFNQSDVLSLKKKESSPSSTHRKNVQGSVQGRRSNAHISPVRSGASSVPSNSYGQGIQPAKSATNPYARPVSAKEIAEDIHGHAIKKIPSASGISSRSENEGSGVLQLNSFMRPQSAAMKEKFEQATSTANSSRKVPPKNEKSSESQLNQPQTGKTTSNGYDQKSDGPYAPDKLAKKPPIIPNLKENEINQKKFLSEMKRVRNLNYTPTKPYSEVSDTDSDGLQDEITPNQHSIIISHAKASSPKRSIPPQTKPVPPKSSLHKHSAKNLSLTATTTMNTEVGSMANGKKMPGTNTMTRTKYYTKSSKAEEVIFEQRPKADGAPSQNKKTSEKRSPTVEDEEDDDEYEDEDESDTFSPSGERLPGDGEASELDDEDDGIDGLDDDCVGSDFEGESDVFSVASSSLSRQSGSIRSIRSAKRPTTSQSATRPAAAIEERQKTFVRPLTANATDREPKPALRPSLFPKIPPTINFVAEGDRVEQLQWDIRKLLKWRMSPITPNIVKSTLARVGFRISKKNHDWLGCFGKHMKSQGFKAIREYQKLNHFPGSFQIGRKDRLWRNLSKMQVHFGKKEFSFFPQTYVLPQDLKLLKRAWEDGGNKQKWIIKPPASARGIGIKVIHKWTQIPRRRPVIVQKYLSRPYLINDSKFDMRVYVYVSGYDPLRIYIFEDGLARFASCKYSSSMKSLNNKFMHLTNYSVNKKNTEYVSNGDDSVCQGHKWSLKALWNYLKRQGVNTSTIWDSIKDLVVKTIISSEAPINSMIMSNVRSRYCVHELFGFDILLDDHMKPWILEVNISPSLHSNSQLDINIKGQMIKDLMNIAGFRIPDKADITHHSSTASCELHAHIPSNNYCMDKRLYSQQVSADERSKHAYYCQRHQDEHVMQTIIDMLTPNDIRVLTECIDEDSRKGCFQRIFPTPSTHKYLRLFEQPRYNNLLLDHWVRKYNRMEQRGINMLQSFCEEGIHLENPTDNTNHQWFPPGSTITSFRESRLYSAPSVKKEKGENSLKFSASTSQLPKMPRRVPRPLPPRSLSQTSSMSSLGTLTPGSSRPLPQTTPR